MIQMLDHTADVGFEIASPTLKELFDEARKALLMVMFEQSPENGEEERHVLLSAADLETLLVRWINELAYLIQDEGFVPGRAALKIREEERGFALEALLAGIPMDAEAYGWQGEIKSATFHGLNVEKVGSTWRAQVILDV